MDRTLEERFKQYGQVIAAALSHADRRTPSQWYLKGLTLPSNSVPHNRVMIVLV